jgi:pre-mRNA-processing factor 19
VTVVIFTLLVSGEIPQEPVVAKTTGLLFEKRLILKSLKEEKKCPVTRTDLTEDDLLTLAANPIAPLRPAAPTSVPSLLHTMQQEWDETVLETFTLRQQLDTTRKELAHALYQYDAACRVIARLMKERDSAFSLVKNFQAATSTTTTNGGGHNNHPSHTESVQMEESHPQKHSEHEERVPREEGISEEVVEELNAVCKKLSSGRKGRKPSEFLQSKEGMSQIQEIQSYKPHKNHEILCFSLKGDGKNDFSVLTGSSDHSIVLSDYSNGQVHCKMNGHRGNVNALAFSPENSGETFFSGSEDNTVRVSFLRLSFLFSSSLLLFDF